MQAGGSQEKAEGGAFCKGSSIQGGWRSKKTRGKRGENIFKIARGFKSRGGGGDVGRTAKYIHSGARR